MATQQEQPLPSAPVQKYDNFVERQLAQASGRVRKLDLAAAALLLLIGTLLYGLTVSVADLYLDLSSQVRLGAFLAYAVAALAYVVLVAVYFGRRRVNPYYAARQLEKTLADAKGSVVNWLDLRDQPLPQAIRGALGARAARDLAEADVDEAISGRRALWLGGITAGLVGAAVVLFLTGPNRFSSLLARAFVPFKEMSIATRTEIVLLQPEGGDATVPLNQKVLFRVQVHGRVPRLNQPDALKLLYRYNPDDAYLEQPLERDADNDWATTILADQVQNGFWYKITGGDAETAEYRVRVRPIAQVTRFDVKYHYRPYHKLLDRLEQYPNDNAVFPHLKDFRGTEVALTVKTNRTLRQGRLEMDLAGAKKDLPGDPVPDNAEALRFKFVLERSGSFRVYFTSQEGESNVDRSPYQIDVIEDRAPLVELHKPGQDVTLPANGTLQLEGSATDDLGIKKLALRLKVIKGEEQPELEPKVYREGKSFELVNGKYPDRLNYKDVVALDGLKTAKKAAFPLTAGMQIEYWLEAVDNSDYPEAGGNVGQSKHYTVTVGTPEKDQQKQQKERQQAQQQQKQHEQQQDKDLAGRNEKAKEEQQAQEDSKDPAAAQKRNQEHQNQAKEIEDALKEQNKPDPRGGAKGESAVKSEAKEKGPPDQAAAKDEKKQPGSEKGASENKDQGNRGAGVDKTQAKDAGNPSASKEENTQGQAKDGGQQPQPQAQAKGDKGGGDSAKQEKSAAKDQAQPQTGAGKDAGAKGQSADAGKAKDDGKGAGGNQQAKAEQKPGGQAAGEHKAEAKSDPKQSAGASSPAKSENKGGPQNQPGQAKDQPQGGQKSELAQSKDGNQQPGQQPSPAQAKSEPQQVGKASDKKGDGAGQQANAAAKDSSNPPQKGAAASERKDQPDPARQPGLAKDAGKTDPRRKEPSAEDVARLQEQLRRGGPQERQKAREELARLEREAKDPNVKDAAKQALKEGQGQQTGSTQDTGNSGSPQKTAQGNPKGDGTPDKSGQPAEGSQTTNGSKQGDNQRSKAQGGNLNNNQSPGAGFQDDLKGSRPNANFANKGGDLHLEDLRKQLTPEKLKELKPDWTEQQQQEFLRWLRQEARRPTQKASGNDKLIRSGSGANLVPGTGPYEVGPGVNQLNNPLDSGHFQPPPEFRDAHRRFTSGGAGKKE